MKSLNEKINRGVFNYPYLCFRLDNMLDKKIEGSLFLDIDSRMWYEIEEPTNDNIKRKIEEVLWKKIK
jgi:hypothetical protein